MSVARRITVWSGWWRTYRWGVGFGLHIRLFPRRHAVVLDCRLGVSGGRRDSGEVLRPVGAVRGNDSSEVSGQLLDDHVTMLLRQRLQWWEQSRHWRVVLCTDLEYQNGGTVVWEGAGWALADLYNCNVFLICWFVSNIWSCSGLEKSL